MIIVRLYTLFDQLQVAAQSTRLSVVNPSGKLIMPALEYVAHPIDEDHAPQDTLEAFSHLIDEIEHGPHRGLWEHLHH